MTKPKILIDISQFAGEPYATGVQRVVRGLLGNWPTSVEGVPAFLAEGQLHLTTIEDAHRAVEAVFSADDGPIRARQILDEAVEAVLPAEAGPVLFDGYLLPEPSFRSDVLAMATQWLERRPDRTFAILCDALPQLEPWAFAGSEQSGTSPYFRFVARLDRVASISEVTRRQLERLAHRGREEGWIVAEPGADGLPVVEVAAKPKGFVAVGTIEPRKRIDVVLDAFEELWQRGADHHLTVVGRPGWADPGLVGRLERLSQDGATPVTWRLSATDAEIASLIAGSLGLLYLSENEGFGLPPLEALALGRPVVVSDRLPALTDLDSNGQIRLTTITAAGLCAAIERLASPKQRAALSADIANVELPSWESFGVSVGSWLSAPFGT